MARNRRVSLQTIAEALALSKYAVSRSLAGKSGVSEETRALVQETAERLGYVRAPTPVATRDVAVIFHDLDPVNSELYVQYQSGIQQEAKRLHIGVRIFWLHAAEELPDLVRTASGVLLIGPHGRALVDTATRTGLPVVRLGWPDPLEDADVVVGTDHEGGQAVLHYLIGLGHRSIAYIYGAPMYRGRQERFFGAREVAERRGDVTLRLLRFDDSEGFAPVYRALTGPDFRPSAIFCSHDGLALKVVSELLGKGHRIPDDLSVIGYGDYSIATQISPPLTTVRTQGQESGTVALRLLDERIHMPRQPGQPARRVQVVARIIERRSAGPTATDG
jgi:LacI family transcriptional regulator